jgi:glyoxylase-like metal-dependent hydrolase (beta-lactamase superfamily II)
VTQNIVQTLDLHFQGQPLSIAAYMLEHSDGVVLVESGPGSTLEALEAALQVHGYGIRHVTHVLLTHIHLDHAGASGYLAQQGAQIFVHPLGAPHLLNPEKLIASATRIYGDLMNSLWGEILPVPQEKLTVLQDNHELVVGKLRFVALNTPGHAEHHYAYQFEDLCFSGDVGAVRIPGYSYLRVPMPPPEFHLEKWRESIARLQKVRFKRIAPTHFGIFNDVDWHLNATLKALDEIESWLLANMPEEPPVDELKRRLEEMMNAQARALGLTEDVITAYRLANPLSMSVDGLLRYWKKYRVPSEHKNV